MVIRLALSLGAVLFAMPLVAGNLASVNPVGFDFGKIKIGDEVSVSVTIRNRSGQSLSLAGGGVSEPQFRGASYCAASIPAGGQCTIEYRFQPNYLGDFEDTARITLSAGTATEYFGFQMRGTGVESLYETYPVALEFGELPTGASMSVPVRVANTHTATLDSFSGGGASLPFQGATDCVGGVAPGQQCEINYSFSSNSPGDFTVNTGFTMGSADGLANSVNLELAGTAVSGAGIARAAPVSIDFGTIKRGRQVTVPVRIYNASAGVLQDFAGGGVSAPFRGATACSDGLASGESCSFLYTFTPDSETAVSRTTSVAFSSSSGGSQSIAIELTGRATGTLARVSPVSIDFGEVRLGDSVSVPVTVFNDSDSALGDFAGGGVGNPHFTGSQNCVSGVPVGGSCQFNYTYSPQDSGSHTAETGFVFSNDTQLDEYVGVSLSGSNAASIFADSFER